MNLKLIDKWLTTKKLKFNYTKSKFIVFSYRKSFSISPLQFGSNTTSQTDLIKFLGISLDDKFNFREHIGYICCKISRYADIEIYRLNKFLLSDTLKIPLLLFSWYDAPQCPRNTVIVLLQMKAIRAIHSLPYNFHTDDFFSNPLNYLNLLTFII